MKRRAKLRRDGRHVGGCDPTSWGMPTNGGRHTVDAPRRCSRCVKSRLPHEAERSPSHQRTLGHSSNRHGRAGALAARRAGPSSGRFHPDEGRRTGRTGAIGPWRRSGRCRGSRADTCSAGAAPMHTLMESACSPAEDRGAVDPRFDAAIFASETVRSLNDCCLSGRA